MIFKHYSKSPIPDPYWIDEKKVHMRVHTVKSITLASLDKIKWKRSNVMPFKPLGGSSQKKLVLVEGESRSTLVSLEAKEKEKVHLIWRKRPHSAPWSIMERTLFLQVVIDNPPTSHHQSSLQLSPRLSSSPSSLDETQPILHVSEVLFLPLCRHIRVKA